MRTLLILPLIGLLVGCTATGQPSQAMIKQDANDAKRLEEVLAGLVKGETSTCVDLQALQGPESYGENTLLFRTGRNTVYKTETRGSCRGVGKDKALVSRTFGSRLCRGDVAQSADLYAGYSSGFCSMGEFTVYRRPKS